MDTLKNALWNLFQDTGNINAYLYYRGCLGKGADHAEVQVKTGTGQQMKE